jgi:hypothetical protein
MRNLEINIRSIGRDSFRSDKLIAIVYLTLLERPFLDKHV